jgi:hypothetical protein
MRGGLAGLWFSEIVVHIAREAGRMSALSFGQRIWSALESSLTERNGVERLRELQCRDEREFQHIAEDVGVSPSELLRLAKSNADAADLLLGRMAALDLDRDEVLQTVPRTLQDLQRVCSLCTSRRRCARDLARRPIDPEWKNYCPNAGTLTALDTMPWAARREW